MSVTQQSCNNVRDVYQSANCCNDDTGVVSVAIDRDGDGFDETVDCDDNDASFYPGAPSSLDGGIGMSEFLYNGFTFNNKNCEFHHVSSAKPGSIADWTSYEADNIPSLPNNDILKLTEKSEEEVVRAIEFQRVELSLMNRALYKWQDTIFGDMRAGNGHSGFVKDIQDVAAHRPSFEAVEPIGYAWEFPYVSIRISNILLNQLSETNASKPLYIKSLTDSKRDELIGDCLFMRSFHYFGLVRVFGDVPLYLDSPVFDALAKTPAAQVYAHIKSDLVLAETLVPLRYDNEQTTRTRPVKGTVQSLLTKVCMEMGDFEQAAQYAKSVMDSGVYSLLPVFDHLWDEEHEYSQEAILELTHVYKSPVSTYAHINMMPMANPMTGYIKDYWHGSDGNKNGQSWPVPHARFNTLTTDLVSDFDEMGDVVRKNSTAWTGDARGPMVGMFYNPYYGPDEPISFLYKIARGANVDQSWFIGSNRMLIRLADIMLLRAEALNQLGSTTEAIVVLNQVRARAQLPPITSTTQQELKLAILKERRLELVGEAQYFYDLKRTLGDQGTVDYLQAMTYTQYDAATQNTTTQQLTPSASLTTMLLPVPESAMSANPLLTQTPGYMSSRWTVPYGAEGRRLEAADKPDKKDAKVSTYQMIMKEAMKTV